VKKEKDQPTKTDLESPKKEQDSLESSAITSEVRIMHIDN
jgi:hypothetical protein